jgi:endogenous inhibitor of DNA gyrase (YacG/DUF329 family)
MRSSNCVQCGAALDERVLRYRPNRKLCSRECRTEWQRANPELFRTRKPTGLKKTRDCAHCGTPFTYYDSSKRPNLYCSHKCSAIVRGRRTRGANNPRYTGVYVNSLSFRSSVRVRFIDRCAICGWDEDSNDICHIVPTSQGGEHAVENVVMLCPNHHRLFDRGKIPVETVRAARENCLPHDSTPASSNS